LPWKPRAHGGQARYRLSVALVVLTVVGDEVEAEMIRGLLRANGIECSLRTTDLSWGSFTGGGGFGPGGPLELVVADEDVVAARRLLPENWAIQLRRDRARLSKCPLLRRELLHERNQSEHTSTKSKDTAPVIVAAQARVVT
jgi:hypothetical protein